MTSVARFLWSRRRSTLRAMMLVAAIPLGLYLVVLVVADNPSEAFRSFLTGPLSNGTRTAQWLSDSAHLTLTGVAVALVFRAGQFSLGAEGQVVVGAFCSAVVILNGPEVPGLWGIGIIAGFAGGFLWGAVPGVLKARAGANEIVTTLLLNFVTLLLFTFVLKTYMSPEGTGYPVSAYLPNEGVFPTLIDNPKVTIAVPLALLVATVITVLFSRTVTGFEMRATGANPAFARASGLRTTRSTWLSMAASGGLAGLAGAAITQGVTERLVGGLSAGVGFDGIAVALAARNRPQFVPVAAAGFAYLRVGGDISQITAGVPRDVVLIIQAAVIVGLASSYFGQRQHRPDRGRSLDAVMPDDRPTPAVTG